MMRRDFITLLGGAAAAWPLAARAQQGERMHHIAVFLGLAENNPASISGVKHLRDALAALGWTDGKNVRFTYRYADGNPTRARALAKEIVEAQTDLIVAHTTPVVAALQNATRKLPIVFVSIPDPVANGFVKSLARPGANLTGFTNFEFAMGAKWLEILKEIAPETFAGLAHAEPRYGVVLHRVLARRRSSCPIEFGASDTGPRAQPGRD
jgi:ABC-type uncharacterized transport system substrate-binding protein